MAVEGVTTGGAILDDLCPHFGICGGCAAQDMEAGAYLEWKLGFAEAAFRRAGLKAALGPLKSVPPASRRRARFAAHRTRSGLALGFRARDSHNVVDMTTCRVLVPELFALTQPLRHFFETLLGPDESGEADALAVNGALDLVIHAPGALDIGRREALTAFADGAGLARISYQEMGDTEPRGRGRRRGRRRREVTVEPEVVAEFRPVQARFGETPVALPPGAFLQATQAGEDLLAKFVIDAVPEEARVADLYSGAGTFTFPLVASGGPARNVAAYDGDPGLIEALVAAARGAGMGERVTGEARNLARRPLRADELAALDAAIIDPPRAGALSQVREIAKCALPLAVMVSCDPGSFARDAKVLEDAGFSAGPVTLVDQFVWTRHLELAAAFRR